MSTWMTYEPCLTLFDCAALITASIDSLVEDFRTTRGKNRQGKRWIVDSPMTYRIRSWASQKTGMPLENVEPVEVVRYEQGASYPLHGDLPWRSHTVLIYLNDDYEGGRTYFPKGPIERPEPKSGWALTWTNSSAPKKPIPEMDHCVEPLTRGAKWVAVCWVQWQSVNWDLRSGVAPA